MGLLLQSKHKQTTRMVQQILEWTKGQSRNISKTQSRERSLSTRRVGRRKITTENTSFYVCGWQGTVDGSLDYLVPKGFVTERNKRKDGSYEVKFESYG